MEDDSLNDVMTMEALMPAHADNRPIVQFLQRLILNNSSQNTMLTNAQIEDILTKEFNIDLSKLHELEIEIYVNVLKKYLKDWPGWDDFDLSVKRLTLRRDEVSLDKLLGDRYANLKKFLQANLDIVKPLAVKSVAKIKNESNGVSEEGLEASDSDVVLEVQATREQLNKLFLKYPNPESQNTIFNYGDMGTTSHITLGTLSLEAILNWWSVAVTINLQGMSTTTNVFLKHETTHMLDHLLVNRKVEKPPTSLVYLNDEIQIKAPKKAKQVTKTELISCINLLRTSYDVADKGIDTILGSFKTALGFLPFCVAPAQYRRYLSRHPYVRYLSANIDTTNKLDKVKYDIQLKETLSPMHQISIGRLDRNFEKSLPPNWLRVDCSKCNKSFTGTRLVTELREHFQEYHQSEPDWHCTNCRKSFPMPYLASRSWSHECEFQVQ